MIGFIWSTILFLVGLIVLALVGFLFVAVCWVIVDTLVEHRKSNKEKDL